MLKWISACVLVLVALSGCSGKPPVDVSVRPNEYAPYPGAFIIDVSSKVDLVKVNSVSVNRGNCQNSGGPAAEIKFGEKAKFYANGCDIKEVEVDTDKGKFQFSF